jgi:hypothetical protein
MMKTRIAALIFLTLFLAACAGQAIQPASRQTASPRQSPATSTDTEAPAMTMVIPTLAPNPTVTADTRQPPERWQEWPVVPTATSRAIEIYRKGLTQGLDPHAFSKVGDCQSVRAAFMGYIDLGNYPSTLKVNYPNLQETIDQFKGHFNTDGQAVRGGFNAASVLSPLWADPHTCLAGENPLECELRLTRPTIVFVRMEIWWDGRTTDSYEKLMRKILDTIIASGAVPILATKADNVEGDNSLNLATARLAYEYDLPLWNFWASVQDMPAHGMETKPPHNDGFHISTAAWNVQSFTGLQALDSVWRGLLAAGPASADATPGGATSTPSFSAITLPAETPAPTVTATPGPKPTGGSDRVVFGVAARKGDGYDYQGVYLFNPADRQLKQVFGEGVQFQAASADGRYILVSEGKKLYRANIDGAFPALLTDSLYSEGNRAAVWLPDGKMAVLLTQPDGTQAIAILMADGTNLGQVALAGGSPIELYPALDENHLYWESGTCTPAGLCTREGAWVSSLDGNLNRALDGISLPLVNPQERTLAFNFSVSATESDLGLAAVDGSGIQQIGLPGKLLTEYSWSPGGDLLAVVMADVSDYSGFSSGNRNLIINPTSRGTSEFPTSELMHPRVLWSPDSQFLFWLGTLPTDGGYKIGAELVDRSSKNVTDLSGALGFSGVDYLLITNAAWLPLP